MSWLYHALSLSAEPLNVIGKCKLSRFMCTVDNRRRKILDTEYGGQFLKLNRFKAEREQSCFFNETWAQSESASFDEQMDKQTLIFAFLHSTQIYCFLDEGDKTPNILNQT